MAFREVSVVQIKELLRRWMAGEGERSAARGAGVARMTARNYIAAAIAHGVDRGGGEDQLTEELIGQICEQVRPKRPDGHGENWRRLLQEEEQIKTWVKQGLTVVKIGVLLGRKGVDVPQRTLARFCVERCGAGRRRVTVRVADPPPGRELQIDFGRLGLVPDPERSRNRVCKALIFTCCYSRHMFVWPTFFETTEVVITGCEAAWSYFGGVFPVIIPDQMAAIINKADNYEPRINDTFTEYAQSRGFVIDVARIASPTDKPRVERVVNYVRNNFFAGEDFRDLTDVRTRAETWCANHAGMRIHGTTQLRPIEVFRTEEQALLLPRRAGSFDVPRWSDPKVHRDFHCEVHKALYSVPHRLVGARLKARADSETVKFYLRGELVKLHPRKPPGQRSTDPADLPSGTEVYATRDIDRLVALAAEAGPAVGTYAKAILDTPLPWTRMRQVYRLLGLVKKWGAARVDQACARALEAEAVSVSLISRMLDRAKEAEEHHDRPPARNVIQGRFARDPSTYAVRKEAGR